jgi:DNA polymerase III subunit gamma/tau
MSGPEGSSIKRSTICATGSPRLDPFSMQYQVLARKWRPRNFHELVGQEHVSRTLLNALQGGRLAHAFLFSGPRGSGKTSSARILAKALNCHAGKLGEPCGDCVACTEIAAGNSMDVLEIDAASNRGIDEIRELKEKARYSPARDKHKIFIIDEVHMLTAEAFNALLKILEEPPPHIVFILATTEYHKIPATILSRCQQYSFKLIRYPLIMERLRRICDSEGVEISDPALEQVVFSSGGSMRDAMSALDQVIAFSGARVRDEDVAVLLGLVAPKILSLTVQAIAQGDLAVILKQVADLAEAGQDLHNFSRRLSGQFRNLMVLKAGIEDPALLGIPGSLLPDLRRQSEFFSKEDLLRIFDAFQKIDTAMKYSTQVRFQLEMGLIELSQIAKLRSLEDVLAEFSAQEKPQDGMVGPPPVRPAPAPAPAPVPPPPTASRRPQPDLSPADAPGSAAAGLDLKDLLHRIAGATGRESLASVLQSLESARIQDDTIILEPGTANEFFRNQIKENLPAITQAASKVVGKQVLVWLRESDVSEARNKPGSSPTASNNAPEPDLLDKAKREPIVKSFIDVFPGRVKAEKIDT